MSGEWPLLGRRGWDEACGDSRLQSRVLGPKSGMAVVFRRKVGLAKRAVYLGEGPRGRLVQQPAMSQGISVGLS